jgi:glutaminase
MAVLPPKDPEMAADDFVVSTGKLPPTERIQELISDAYERFRHNDDGENAPQYPALTNAPRNHFGICIASVRGLVYAAGDADVPFTLMSVAKPFVLALVCQEIGVDQVRRRIGVNSTGLPFNSLAAVENGDGHRTNPMVNSGAIATTSLIPGDTLEAKWTFLLDGMSRFAGRRLALNEAVYASASATNHRNQSIVQLLDDLHRVYFEPKAALDLYTRQCSLEVTTRDLAVMGAALANGGINPVTGERVVQARLCQRVLAVMATAGMYETSGDWLYDTGLPAKSGIGGGIITVAPGKGGLGTFAPPLDEAGNSVKGQMAARYLSTRLGLNIFASKPAK